MKLKNVKVGKKYKIKYVNDSYHMEDLKVGDIVQVTDTTYTPPDNIRVVRLGNDLLAFVGAECLKRIKPKLKVGDTCVLLEGFDAHPRMSGFSVGDEVKIVIKEGHDPKWKVNRLEGGFHGWTYKKYLKKVKGD